ncbi:MAG: 3-dehydroquinate synthase [Clostridia bacterium]
MIDAKLILQSAKGACHIYIQNGLLDAVGSLVARHIGGRNAVVVADSNTYPLFGDRVRKSLEAAGFAVAFSVFEAGETRKTPATYLQMLADFHAADLTRSGVVIALGGGVCGDVAGFAASTYLRGVPVIQVPTTLLAQVDSSIGGKTGIDMPFGKNSVGAFHQPTAVITDPLVLESLSARVFSDGMAEVIKYGCIRDAKLLEPGIAMEELIYRCVKIKVDVVQADEFDRGERMLLNFGHTVGHAIEKVLHFSGLTHGEAVGIGMVMAAKIGAKLGEADVTAQISAILKANNLPTTIDLDVDLVCDALGADKKRDAATIKYVILEKIGVGELREISLADLKELVKEVWA